MDSLKPDFLKTIEIADEFLLSSDSITSIPFSVESFIEQDKDVRIRSFKTASKYGLDVRSFGSDSASIIRHNGKYILFYNELKPVVHTRFSLAHEYGHLCLGHLDAPRTAEIYHTQEIEAGFFAAQLLMPEAILRAMDEQTNHALNTETIARLFNVSRDAAQRRLNKIRKVRYPYVSITEDQYNRKILSKFRPFIERSLIYLKSNFYTGGPSRYAG